MLIAKIQFSPWDKVYNFNPRDLDLKIGDKVVIKTELGLDIGRVMGFFEKDDKNATEDQEGSIKYKEGEEEKIIKPILRRATPEDIEKVNENNKEEAIYHCKEAAERKGLEIKIVDVAFSLDGVRLTIAFLSENRIDFRDLVKDLGRHFNRSIRMQQIGTRDEAKFMGDHGHCGRSLCCREFLGDFTSITSNMSELQQCGQRGSDRVSGACGRLMCCLSYEQKGYEELKTKIPPVGTKVNVDGKKGVIIGYHTLKQTVDVQYPPEKPGEKGIIVEVDLNRKKKEG
jgi:cell fate regulator YaaT (PSP1 superfamily)